MPHQTHQCTTCGHEWLHGQSGSHCCSTRLCARIKELEDQLSTPPLRQLTGSLTDLSLTRTSNRHILLDITTQLHGKIVLEITEDRFTDLLFGIACVPAIIRHHYPKKRPIAQ